MIKLCIFDLDGTLVNSLCDLADSMNYALTKHGYTPHATEQYKMLVGSGVSVLADRASGNPDMPPEKKQALLSDFSEYYDQHCLNKTRPYIGIPELLSALDERGVCYSVMSNKPDVFSKRIVSALFPQHHFASVWGKRDGFERKPCPDAVWALIDEQGFDRSECLYIGDSDVDICTARNAGLKKCGVSWGFRTVKELRNAGADFIADTPADILSLL